MRGSRSANILTPAPGRVTPAAAQSTAHRYIHKQTTKQTLVGNTHCYQQHLGKAAFLRCQFPSGANYPLVPRTQPTILRSKQLCDANQAMAHGQCLAKTSSAVSKPAKHLFITCRQDKSPVLYYILNRTNQPGGGGEDNSCAMEAEDTPGASGPCVLF